MSKILILCTGNSCRSPMAEGILRAIDPALEVYSAGTYPAHQVHPYAVEVLHEIGIDIRDAKPKNVDRFIGQNFDFVVTVCDHAKETCPVFSGGVKHRVHMGFRDPISARGSEEDILNSFREVRDEIRARFQKFYEDTVVKK
ncbi:MAG: arsenate reductase ArsC [Bacteroidota bacterium]